jgi:hypothetical protein
VVDVVTGDRTRGLVVQVQRGWVAAKRTEHNLQTTIVARGECALETERLIPPPDSLVTSTLVRLMYQSTRPSSLTHRHGG